MVHKKRLVYIFVTFRNYINSNNVQYSNNLIHNWHIFNFTFKFHSMELIQSSQIQSRQMCISFDCIFNKIKCTWQYKTYENESKDTPNNRTRVGRSKIYDKKRLIFALHSEGISNNSDIFQEYQNYSVWVGL